MISRVHHLGIVLPSADDALRFYRDILGLTVTEDRVVEEQGVRGVLLQVGENEIELLEPVREDTGVARFLQSRGPTMHHICLATDDIVAELARLKAQDVQLIDESPRNGLAGLVAFIHPKAMRGVLVELAQPPAGAHTSTAKGFDRIGLQTSDLDAAGKLWHDICGLDIARRHEVPEAGMTIGEMPCSQVIIDVLAPSSVDGVFAQKIAAEGERAISAVVLQVPDVDAAVAHYRARGARISDAQPGSYPGTREAVIDATDAFGLAIMFRQYA